MYRRWVADISESYRRTISLYQEQFEAGAKKMKDIRNMEDFEILKNADVVGMTTTGKLTSSELLWENPQPDLVLNIIRHF